MFIYKFNYFREDGRVYGLRDLPAESRYIGSRQVCRYIYSGVNLCSVRNDSCLEGCTSLISIPFFTPCLHIFEKSIYI